MGWMGLIFVSTWRLDGDQTPRSGGFLSSASGEAEHCDFFMIVDANSHDGHYQGP